MMMIVSQHKDSYYICSMVYFWNKEMIKKTILQANLIKVPPAIFLKTLRKHRDSSRQRGHPRS